MSALKERMPELHQRFAAGEGNDIASRKALGAEFGVAHTTIGYHRRDWVKNGMPGLATGKTDDQVEQTEPAAPAPAAAEPAASEPAVEPPAAAPEPPDPPAPELKLPDTGEVYEGVVDRLDPRGQYALVNLTAFYDDIAKRWIRGKVEVRDIRRDGKKVWNLRDELKEGQLINVRVVKVTIQPGSDPKVALSIKAAPPHPSEPAPPEPEPTPDPPVRKAPPMPLPTLAPADAPIVANGAEIAAALEAEEQAAKAAANAQAVQRAPEPPQPAPALETAPEPPRAPEQPIRTKAPAVLAPSGPVDLCATCAGAKWCGIRHQVNPTLIPDAEDLPDHMPDLEVEFGPRPVTKCSAYEPKQYH